MDYLQEPQDLQEDLLTHGFAHNINRKTTIKDNQRACIININETVLCLDGALRVFVMVEDHLYSSMIHH